MTDLNYKIRVQDDYKILDMWSRWSRDGGSVNEMYMRCNIRDWDVPKIQDLLTRSINNMILGFWKYDRDESEMQDY